MHKIFIDGSAGTTGLRIRERLAQRSDLELLILDEASRKDPDARRAALNACDVAFLCLPDAAAVEAVGMVENDKTVVIDTSTAHRTADGWSYGFPELLGKREEIAASRRIANPGCHASGFVALAEPLIRRGVLAKDTPLTAYSLTGYSGGGKKMIAEYEDAARDTLLDAPRMYGLGQTHKHLPEMKAVTGLARDPIFCPVVAPYYSGMEVTVPIFGDALSCSLDELCALYADYYRTGVVRFVGADAENGFLSANAMSGRDDLQISVQGNADRILLVARFDNLGKGASGAAIQNMNLILGVNEAEGLVV